MRRHLPVLVAWLAALLTAAPAAAQLVAVSTVRPASDTGGFSTGRVDGVVRDESGTALPGASILALGTALAIVRTDSTGRFSLALPPGQYVLRAALDGYISSFRESVRVYADAAVTRTITLVRDLEPEAQARSAIEGADAPANGARTGEHAHTPTAWRLRHMPRSVLREVGLLDDPAVLSAGVSPQDGTGWLVLESGRTASTLMTRADLTGQVNLLATGSLPATGEMSERSELARGVAYVVVGAPVGSHGDWLVRAAMAPGERSSWAFQGEYTARRDSAHAFRAGVSYAAQHESVEGLDGLPPAGTAAGTHRAGGVYGFDRWTVAPGFVVDYGAKVARYDYLVEPALVSARLGVRAAMGSRLAVTGGVSPRMVAPGAEQFLPPAATGAWLPPERTFTSLAGPLAPERIEDYDVGLEARLTPALVATVRAFSETTENQVATVFGLDRNASVGNYHVAAPGSVDVNGISVELDGQLLAFVHGRVSYSRTQAFWVAGPGADALARVAPAIVRTGAEWGHDLTTSLDATVPGTTTQVTLAYRVSNLFSDLANSPDGLGPGGRFNVEVRQRLPYKPLRDGEFNVLVAARTLVRDVWTDGSFYDELLTDAPPLQVICGLQMRF